MKKFEIEIPEGKRAEWKEVDGHTVLALVDEEDGQAVSALIDEADNRPVTERIKTFGDALRELEKRAKSNEGIALMPADFESNECNIKTKGTLAYMKLCIIAAALNEGWEPPLTINKIRYYPGFFIYTQDEIDNMDEEEKKSLVLCGGPAYLGKLFGLGYSHPYINSTYDFAALPARLYVKSEELADYFGKQFIDIWADLIFQK